MSTCKSCGEPIRWVEMAASRKRLPLHTVECKPTAPGAIIVVDGWGYSLQQLGRAIAEREGLPLVRALELAAVRYPAHLAHFSRCPYAAQHRRAG